jgi:hypothetical protein
MLTMFPPTQSDDADKSSDLKSTAEKLAQAPKSKLISPVVPLENGSA